MEGLSAAYFVYPGLIDATAYFAQAARETGLRSIVNMSQISARREWKSHQVRDDWISERVFSFRNAVRMPQTYRCRSVVTFSSVANPPVGCACSLVSAEEATTASRSPSLN
jgi:hypothetical protein